MDKIEPSETDLSSRGAPSYSGDTTNSTKGNSTKGNSTKGNSSRWRTNALYFGWGVAIIVAVIGICGRYYFVMGVHRPSNMEFAKIPMNGYEQRAINSLKPTYKETVYDIVHPPGGHIFLAMLISDGKPPKEIRTKQDRRHYRWRWAVRVQFLLAVLVPFLIAGIGYELYGHGVAIVSLMISSLYFSFVDYAGYFMTEGNYLFFMVLSLWLLIRAIRVREVAFAVPHAFLAGLALAVTASLKTVILLPGVLIFVTLGIVAWRWRWRRLPIVMACSFVGLMLLIVPMIVRASRINEKFTAISTNGAMTVLMGHQGKVRRFNFRDSRGRRMWFSPPSGVQNKYKKQMKYDFGPWDSKEMLRAAWKWTKENPEQAFLDSCQSVLDLYYGSIAFPSNRSAKWKQWVILYEKIFWYFILIPTIAFGVLVIFKRFYLGTKIELADILVVLPILALMFVAFFTIGQPRYRIPFDAFYILLASRFYTWGAMRSDGLVPPEPETNQVAVDRSADELSEPDESQEETGQQDAMPEVATDSTENDKATEDGEAEDAPAE